MLTNAISLLRLSADVSRPDKLSSADVSSICQAAGLQAVRKNRYVILPVDFEEAYKGVVRKGDDVMDFCACETSLFLSSLRWLGRPPRGAQN